MYADTVAPLSPSTSPKQAQSLIYHHALSSSTAYDPARPLHIACINDPQSPPADAHVDSNLAIKK
jgi:hypothetical protein